MNDNHLISIHLLDKILQIRCPEDKSPELQKAARHLDNKMREVAEAGKALGHERILATAAINVIYDLLAQQNQKDIYIDSLSSRIRELQNNYSKALSQTET